MPTANYDKFIQLRKSGVDAQTAKKQAYGDIPTATTIQEQPVQPTGGATLPIAPQVAPTQPVTPAPTPAPMVEAQRDPITGLTKPLATPTQMVAGSTDQEIINAGGRINNGVQEMPAPKAPTAPKVEPVIDYTKAQGREAEIQANLEGFKAKGMTPDEIMRASDYQNASPEKKALIEPYLKQTAPTTGAMFQSIVAKVDIPDTQKQLPSYKIAENRYLKATKYSSMTPYQVSQEMNDGKLIEGSRTWEDLAQLNPKLAQDTNNLRIVNGGKTNIFTYKNNPDGTPVVENNLEKTFTQDYLDDYGDFLREVYKPETMEEITAKIYTPDVKTAQDKATEVELELIALEKDINSIESDVDKELTGTGATGSRARLEKAIRAEKLRGLYDSTLKTYTVYANKANNLINQNTAVYQEEYKQKSALSTALGTAGKTKFENEQALAQNQAEFEQGLAQNLETMNDPTSAISTLVEEYKKNGIPTETAQSLINKFNASGMDLATYLESVQSEIRKSPEYQAYKAKQSGTEWQSTNITRYNPATGANESTPIFYRKKTSGGFEAVDLAGNPIDVSSLTGGGTAPTFGTLPSSFTGDTASYIASKEGFRENAYLDSAGVPTVGYGFTSVNGKPVKMGDKITKEQADAEFGKQIERHSTWKTLIDENSLSPAQKTALASFEYNLGPGIWNKSAMNIIDMIKAGDLVGAAKEMKKYNQAGGKVVQGLVNRREDEANLLLSQNEPETQKFEPADVKSFENYDGKTIPAQYAKTPLQQQEFITKYNEWRANQVNNPIKTGEDILKVQLSDKATEQEKNAIQYGSRMLNAINDLGTLEETYSKLPLKDQIYQEYAPNLLKSDNQKTLESRKKDFITAVLRKESGASIALSEFANEEKKYFAQPGDSPGVISAKQNARNFAIKAILSAAGKDINGKLVSGLYNPPAITPQTETGNDIEARIKAIRNANK